MDEATLQKYKDSNLEAKVAAQNSEKKQADGIELTNSDVHQVEAFYANGGSKFEIRCGICNAISVGIPSSSESDDDKLVFRATCPSCGVHRDWKKVKPLQFKEEIAESWAKRKRYAKKKPKYKKKRKRGDR